MELKSLKERLRELIILHPGKFLGSTVGLSAGISLITLGLWRTLILALMSGIGYAIGKWIDDEGKGLKEFLEEKLPGRFHFH